MTTSERIEILARVAAKFPELGAFGQAEALRELVRTELGSEDTWEQVNEAYAPKKILHVISANTPMAGMQTLIRGLILGSMNWCKIPGAGLPRFQCFVQALPSSLAHLIEISRILPEEWRRNADAVVVFGSDETVEKFRRETGPGQIFAGYGNRWSGAVILSDPSFESVVRLTRDVCLYEQKGCLSAQIVWLHESIEAEEYGRRLAEEISRFASQDEISKLGIAEAGAIARWRAAAEWMELKTDTGNHWFSEGEPAWGVVLRGDGITPGLSCLHRHVTLARFTGVADLDLERDSVSTLGIWPNTAENQKRLNEWGASRICAVGEMQFPHPTWRQDGFPALGRLVRQERP